MTTANIRCTNRAFSRIPIASANSCLVNQIIILLVKSLKSINGRVESIKSLKSIKVKSLKSINGRVESINYWRKRPNKEFFNSWISDSKFFSSAVVIILILNINTTNFVRKELIIFIMYICLLRRIEFLET